MIEEFVSRMFALRDGAHLAHWAAKGPGSYAEHQALGAFYDEVVDRVDGIIEAYQGFFGLIKKVNPLPYSKDKFIDQLQSEAKWLAENCDAVCYGNAAVENMLYDLEGFMAQTYYKLKNLK
jgi:DNA-binding ferritin-like protein